MFVSCCFCQKEYNEHCYNVGAEGCGADLTYDVINCGYHSDFDCEKYIFLNKYKPYGIKEQSNKHIRTYNRICIEHIIKFNNITPSRGNVGEYTYIVCNSCIRDLAAKKQIVCINEAIKSNPCALCNCSNPEYYFNHGKLYAFENYKPVKSNFNPVRKGIQLLDDLMSVCMTCYFFYK